MAYIDGVIPGASNLYSVTTSLDVFTSDSTSVDAAITGADDEQTGTGDTTSEDDTVTTADGTDDQSASTD